MSFRAFPLHKILLRIEKRLERVGAFLHDPNDHDI